MKSKSPVCAYLVAPFISAIIFFTMFSSCQEKKGSGDDTGVSKLDSTIIIMRSPDVSQQDFWNYINEHSTDSVQLLCGSCDSSIVLLPRSFLSTVLDGSGLAAKGGSLPPDGPTGASIGNWCSNFNITIEKPKERGKQSDIKVNQVSYENEDTTIVAVLDTGVDSAMLAYNGWLYTSKVTSCLGADPSIGVSANNGWNFVDKNANVHDDFDPDHGHGSNVAHLIMEQAQNLKHTPVKILPVKLLDKNGQGTLFDLMCGMAYAVKSGAQIINASLGFYVCDKPDSASLVFKQFIKDHLTANNVLLIAAAGNTQTEPSCGNLRNLDKISFFPASFAGDPEMKNVISVTTVAENPGRVSPTQNFSGTFVDLGVVGDVFENDSFMIANPRVLQNGRTDFIEGSSYAAPIVTGVIAANYKFLKENNFVLKEDIIQHLVNINRVFIDPLFSGKNEVKKGRILRHN